MTTVTQGITWADSHPQVARNFARKPLPWPCDHVRTDLAFCHQPTIVRERGGALFTHGTVHGEQDPLIWHSQDGGRTWVKMSRAPVLAPPLPPEATHNLVSGDGIGVTASGTILIGCRRYWDAQPDDGNPIWYNHPSSRGDAWILRSEDRGRSWQRAGVLDPETYLCIGGDVVRIHQMADGRLLYPQAVGPWSHVDDRRPDVEWRGEAFLFESADDGRSWHRMSSLGLDTCECDLLELPSGRILATARYQRKRVPGDPENMVSPEWLEFRARNDYGNWPSEPEGYCFYKQTAVLFSDDGGRNWSTPRLVTGWVQQTACLVRLSDGTIVMPFGHKDDGQGQRFILSYDEGETWSNAVFELNKFGMYANSIVLEDDTIVTVTETPRWHQPVKLHVLRWQVPSREVVEEHGSFTPREVG